MLTEFDPRSMERMTLFGNNKDNMADCTNAL
jgi:hypothetical protein